jgi:hypothetical protein
LRGVHERARGAARRAPEVGEERVEIATIEKARQEAMPRGVGRIARGPRRRARAVRAEGRATRRASSWTPWSRTTAACARTRARAQNAQRGRARPAEDSRRVARAPTRAARLPSSRARSARATSRGDEGRRRAAEFTEQLAKEYPGDPEVVAARPRRRSVPSTRRPRDRGGGRAAAALRDHFQSVYERPQAAAATTTETSE